jgi:hypothetical protein
MVIESCLIINGTRKISNNLTIIKTKIMGNLLYIIAVILVIIWAIGFFAVNAGSIIHILLIIAIVAVLLRIIQGGKHRTSDV